MLRLRIFDTALGGAGEAVFDLPADGWGALGKPDRVRGFRFSGGGCNRVRVVVGKIDISCSGSGVTLSPPGPDDDPTVEFMHLCMLDTLRHNDFQPPRASSHGGGRSTSLRAWLV